MNLPAAHTEMDRLADALIARSTQDGHPITCRGSGCFGCCKEPVLAFRSEVEYALASLDDAQRERVKERTRLWAIQVRASGLLNEKEPHVYMWRALGAWCPFLEEGQCSVYARRPLSCRSHFAIGNPENCHDDQKRLQQTYAYAPDLTIAILALALSTSKEVAWDDNMGVWLVEILLGKTLKSAARRGLRVTPALDTTTPGLLLELHSRPE